MIESEAWLKNCVEPWDQVVFHWDNTYQNRQNSTTHTLPQFLCEWPILKHPESITLVILFLCASNK